MSLFSRATFSAAGYAAFRPSYPPQLYKTVLDFRSNAASSSSPSSSGTLLDLGCGHGVICRSLSPHFDRVIGIDPSDRMIKQATESTADDKVSFRQGTSDDLSFLPDKSVDMVVAGQAAHWFDYAKTWPELARVVRRGGTLAFWGYKDNILLGYPAANAVIEKFCYGDGEVTRRPGSGSGSGSGTTTAELGEGRKGKGAGMEGMLPYWEPGRFVLRNALREVVPPETDWEDVKRLVYDPDRDTSSVGKDEHEAAWQRKKLKLGEFEGYVRTFSAYVGWRDAHPEMKSRVEGGEGDLVDAMFDELVEAVPEWKAADQGWKDIEVDAIWGTALIMATRR